MLGKLGSRGSPMLGRHLGSNSAYKDTYRLPTNKGFNYDSNHFSKGINLLSWNILF